MQTSVCRVFQPFCFTATLSDLLVIQLNYVRNTLDTIVIQIINYIHQHISGKSCKILCFNLVKKVLLWHSLCRKKVKDNYILMRHDGKLWVTLSIPSDYQLSMNVRYQKNVLGTIQIKRETFLTPCLVGHFTFKNDFLRLLQVLN